MRINIGRYDIIEYEADVITYDAGNTILTCKGLTPAPILEIKSCTNKEIALFKRMAEKQEVFEYCLDESECEALSRVVKVKGFVESIDLKNKTTVIRCIEFEVD